MCLSGPLLQTLQPPGFQALMLPAAAPCPFSPSQLSWPCCPLLGVQRLPQQDATSPQCPHRVILPASQTHQTRTRTKLFVFLPEPSPTSGASCPTSNLPPGLHDSFPRVFLPPLPHLSPSSRPVLLPWQQLSLPLLLGPQLVGLLTSLLPETRRSQPPPVFFFHPQTSRGGKSRHWSFLSLPCHTSSAAGDPCLQPPVALDKGSSTSPLSNPAGPFHNSHHLPHHAKGLSCWGSVLRTSRARDFLPQLGPCSFHFLGRDFCSLASVESWCSPLGPCPGSCLSHSPSEVSPHPAACEPWLRPLC